MTSSECPKMGVQLCCENRHLFIIVHRLTTDEQYWYTSTLPLGGSNQVQYKSEKFVLFDSCFILFMIILN